MVPAAAENPSPSEAVSKAGIITNANGERHIPSSVRADGSIRKEIRVRPGYRPPEDVEVYKNRAAEAWKNRGKSGVPGADPVPSAGTTASSSQSQQPTSAAASKNAKRREARKKAAAAATVDENGQKATSHATTEAIPAETDEATANATADAEPAVPAADSQAEKEKEARKLAKKLRQAKELKDKKDKGGELLPEQFEKVIRINELIRQLDNLGFGADGEKKSET
ncbi:hypothetical protein BDY21DRAFT_25867 [Lineolata rhizophorae]|uniref:WIBG Mago-binding domain-containing protein n=1 Tax=Lineolata rhizophorae TaxID=578093 RepID=A0A6A6P125_9PEZI|nr:hypothetical protein BDY21DRAFT_25867 [Lineolata rhizophorae]